MAIFHHYDTILVHQLSPITVGIPALIIKKIHPKTKLLFWVLDLWPESLKEAGGITNPKILGVFERIAKSCYRNSDRILMSSKGFAESICAKGDFGDKLEYFPNWPDGELAEQKDYQIPTIPDGFKVMFAGNIGEAQDFEHTLEAFRLIYEQGIRNIHFIVVGDGRKKQWVENFVVKHKLSEIVHCVGRHPLNTMSLFFSQANVLFLALKDSLIFNLTCPAKLQAYMSVGKPVLAMLNGEGASIIADAQCGYSVNAEDAISLSQTLIELSKMNSEELKIMGQNGQSYCKMHFSFQNNMQTLEKLINE